MSSKKIDLEKNDDNKTLLLPAVLLSGFIELALGKS